MQDTGRNSNKDSNMDNDMNNNANNNVNEQPLSDDKRLREMYDKLVGYEKTIHEQNQKRIKIGLRCIYIIPLFFSCAADDCAGQFKNHFSCTVDSESVCYRSVFNWSRVCGL